LNVLAEFAFGNQSFDCSQWMIHGRNDLKHDAAKRLRSDTAHQRQRTHNPKICTFVEDWLDGTTKRLDEQSQWHGWKLLLKFFIAFSTDVDREEHINDDRELGLQSHRHALRL
jgi:hypothetical protein